MDKAQFSPGLFLGNVGWYTVDGVSLGQAGWKETQRSVLLMNQKIPTG